MFRCLLLVLAMFMSACSSSSDSGTLTELTRVRSGDLDVVLLSEDGTISRDGGGFVVEFRSAENGALVDPGPVKASATMPMPGSSPMFGSVDLTPSDAPGRFTGAGNFTMAGTWRLNLEWDGPAGRGSLPVSLSVQ